MEVKRAEVKNMTLQHLYERVRKGTGDKEASASTIRRSLGLKNDVSTAYLEVLLESLLDDRYVRIDGRSRFAITEEGIEFIESGWAFSQEHYNITDSWNKPDGEQTLTVSAIQSVQQHLRQCIILIDATDFSQEEKAQIVGLIRICEQIVNLPTPKLGLLKRILSWLKEIKELLPLIEAALKLIGKA
ncbi:MAG: hypothetical protein KGM49_09910 [Sphingomonadales bacterium]|nr:hypothetical protein [Sphingomonadales bacterium]